MATRAYREGEEASSLCVPMHLHAPLYTINLKLWVLLFRVLK